MAYVDVVYAGEMFHMHCDKAHAPLHACPAIVGQGEREVET